MTPLRLNYEGVMPSKLMLMKERLKQKENVYFASVEEGGEEA
jgi:hypothetical protein